jgi:hypothetical protein
LAEVSPKREIKETTSADTRLLMGETKISGGEQSKIFNATMTSAKTFEEQKGMANENTTLSKTPSIRELEQIATIKAAAEEFMISPSIFKKKH